MHCHHEKLVIVDDEVAFVGGIDLTDLAGDRSTARGHPARGGLGLARRRDRRCAGRSWPTWRAHFALRWHEATGERLAGAARRRPRRATSCRSCAPCPRRSTALCREASSRILESYVARAALGARVDLPREPVPVVARDRRDAGRQAARPAAASDFRVVVLLPAKPNNGADDTRGQLGGPGRRRRRRGPLARPHAHAAHRRASGPLYVHAKVGIVDDRWLTIGSANLNEHSLFNDTEMNIVTLDRAARARHAAAPLVRAPRAPDRRRLGRAGAGHRRACGGRSPPSSASARNAATPSPTDSGAARRIATLEGAARTTRQPDRRRLSPRPLSGLGETHRCPGPPAEADATHVLLRPGVLGPLGAAAVPGRNPAPWSFLAVSNALRQPLRVSSPPIAT